MTDYPTENSLTLHVTHGLLNWLQPRHERAIATSPTRFDEGDRGYDVQHELARNFQLQYKRPKGTPTKNFSASSTTRDYIKFEVDRSQLTTLKLNRGVREPFLALPKVLSKTDLRDAHRSCVFIDAYAVKPKTSLLYIPKNGSGEVFGKILNGPNYRLHDGHYRYQEFKHRVEDEDFGITVRDRDGLTQLYRNLLKRRFMLTYLYKSGWENSPHRGLLTDGGEDELPPERNEEFAERLQEHVVNQTNQSRQLYDIQADSENVRDEVNRIFRKMRRSRDPSVYRISRSREFVLEDGGSVPEVSLSTGRRQ